ncbi:phosphatase PAP2 family protein [Kibdelosporangium aridum]|uniref:Phosphatase PAP2 family protein n=1 Tax=Kibdelosporangium aridum TaxID=2030 RepID=A0A428Y8C3_KIBAR|nr:vanadium-dependent haloperoxidase [Kibdelosporangium aridum]RSM63842.1 phosphatase PAP2 family protein [Kibdelosporangium aridum]
MQKIVLALVLSLAGVGLSAPADAEPRSDSVRVWNELALAAVRATRASDADAARTYAMLNVAIYDAVNGLASSARTHALIPGPGPHGADPHAAAVAAAHGVLVRLDPDRTVDYDTQLSADLAGLRPGHRRDAGVRWGREVAQRVVASRADDGSTPVRSQPAGSGPGAFRAEWSGVQYRDVRPFAVVNPAAYIPGPPPALDSLDYAAAFAEVALLGDAAIPAPDKLATFQFWSVPAGTGQPAGEWVKIALTVSRDLQLAASARLMALLTMTLADTTVPTVGTKFTYRHWRPATAIREAETDGNPLTQPNPSWTPRAGSIGGTPEYPSGHSSYSGAAAAVLAGFFCADNVRFVHTTDTAPGGQARTYPSFSAAAAEAGRSRVFGGQHFEFSNQAGLAIGRDVATEVLATRLLKRTGPTHHGHCPL